MSEQQIDTPRIDTIRLQSIARGFTETAVFYAAIDLDIFTHISQGAATIEAVASAANITALNAERIVVVLLALGLIEKDDAGHLHNAPDCEKFMVSTSDRFAGPWMTFTRREVPQWFDLTATLRDLTPPAELGMYDDMTVERARKYHAATYSIGMGAGRRFARHVDMSSRTRLLDLGGGSGAYSIQAVKAYPGLQAIVLDLPAVTVVTQEYIEQNHVADRVTTFGGDFVNSELPAGCDIAVMASNLPIYSAANIQKVVQKTFDALEPGGEMHLVGETLHADGVGPLDASMWGMAEALYGSGGRSHSVTECVGYFETAGFVDVETVDFVAGTLTRTIGHKPG
jgi:SAM-dependent methyltransferase